jgi:cell division protein ZipA
MHWNPADGIPLLIIGLIVLVLIWLFGQPRKPGQGRRTPASGERQRREPTLGGEQADDEDASVATDGTEPSQGELDIDMRGELERLGATLAGERATAHGGVRREPTVERPATAEKPAAVAPAPRSELGRRPADSPVERIVTLFVMARDGQPFHGSDLVVAMEKAGLEFGDMGIFHRMLDGKPELGPIFSVANMIKPGSFDMARVAALETPGLSFFMTLPGPIPALDAWDPMLPTAQRLGELLDGLVLDEDRNALGRQRIAYIRDDLRGWDRRHEGEEIPFGR